MKRPPRPTDPEDLITRLKAGERTGVFALVFYFGLLLVPEWWPAYSATPAYFMYILTLPIALLMLDPRSFAFGPSESRWTWIHAP